MEDALEKFVRKLDARYTLLQAACICPFLFRPSPTASFGRVGSWTGCPTGLTFTPERREEREPP